MARRKKDAANGALENLDIDVPDVTAAVMPDGVPMSADGSVAEDADIPVEDARKVGAIDAASAQHNKRVARTIHKKISGQSVRWNEADAIFAFDNVKRAFDPSTLWIVIQRKEPGVPDEDYQPILMSSFKDSAAMYDHVLRKIHKNRSATTYLVRFKDGGGQRSQGFLRMPDTTNETIAEPQKGPDMGGFNGQLTYPPVPLPGGGFGYPQGGQGYPQGGQGYPYGYQGANGYQQGFNAGLQQGVIAPQMQSLPMQPVQPQVQPQSPPVQPQPAPAPTPQPQPLPPAATHENHYYNPPPGPQRDPGLEAAVATTYQELKDTKQVLFNNQLQIERLLGELAEMRRTQMAMEQRAQTAPAAPPVQPVQPAPYNQQPVMTPYGPQPAPNGYGPPQPAYGANVPMPAPQRHAVDPQAGPPQPYPQSFPGQNGPYMAGPQQMPYGAPQPASYGQQYGAPQQMPYNQPPPQQPPYGPPSNGAPPPAQRGWGAPQAGVGQPPPQQQDAMGAFSSTMGQAVSMISGMTRAMAEIQRTVGNSLPVNPPPEYEDDDDLPNIPPPPPDQPKPFHTMPLGFGESAPTYAYNEDGSPNVTGILLGNIPKVGNWLRGAAEGINSVRAQMKPGVGQLPEPNVVQMPPSQQQYLPAQHAQAAQPAPAPAPQPPSMMPSLASVQSALGQR